MNKAFEEDALEDSTDWLKTPLSSLAAVDSALRCQICKDFYQTPMITSCMHTFCSLCIRRSLSTDGKCPACRTKDQELKLRNNNAMEELVEAFKKARPDVLEFARRPVVIERRTSPKRSREIAELEEEETPRKRTRSSKRTAGRKMPATITDDGDEEDEDYVDELNLEPGFVECPVCCKKVQGATINGHLDRGCKDETRTAKPLAAGSSKKGSAQSPYSISDPPVKRPERLAQINFSMMKEAALRKKLADAGINASGNKSLMERRYTEWISLWNSNCDATRPIGKIALKRELEKWERTQGARAHTSNYAQSSGAQIKDKEFDGKAYSNANNDSFKDLIANARKKAAVKLPTPEESSSEDRTPVVLEAPADEMDIEVAERGREAIDEISPVKLSGSQRRFLKESSETVSIASQKSPSQYSSSLTLLEKDSGIASDMPRTRTIQQ